MSPNKFMQSLVQQEEQIRISYPSTSYPIILRLIMSLTREEWVDIWERLKRIEQINLKVWRAGKYKWSNAINWEVQRIKEKVQNVIGQME